MKEYLIKQFETSYLPFPAIFQNTIHQFGSGSPKPSIGCTVPHFPLSIRCLYFLGKFSPHLHKSVVVY